MAAERLFFALWPPDRVREQLSALAAGLPGPAGRLTHPDDLHATLAFLGAVDPARRTCIEQVASRLSATGFTLLLDRIGWWPGPRIRWCGQALAPRPLVALVQGLEGALAGCGWRPDRRPFRLHVTLARKAAPLPPGPVEPGISWEVGEFALAASRPWQRPAYSVLARWPLPDG